MAVQDEFCTGSAALLGLMYTLRAYASDNLKQDEKFILEAARENPQVLEELISKNINHTPYWNIKKKLINEKINTPDHQLFRVQLAEHC